MYSEKNNPTPKYRKWEVTRNLNNALFNIFKELLKKKEKMASNTFNNSTCSD